MQTLETKQYLTSTLANTLQNTINLTELDLNRKVTKALEKCTYCIYSLSNEPTLACYCIEEHLIKTGVQLTDKREEMRKLDKQLSGALFDMEFSIESIKRMKNSNENFKTTQDLIKNAIFCKQQIDYNDLTKRKFQQQMNKDHSVDDFRSLINSSTAKEAKLNAFQRFSTSFEASIEGLASNVDFKEFKAALQNISQLTTSSTSSNVNSNQSNISHSNDKQSIVSQSSVDQPSTSSKVLNEIIKEEENELRKDTKDKS